MSKLYLLLAFTFLSIPAYALNNDAAREEMPGQDANLTSDTIQRAPTDQPPVSSGPSTFEGDGEPLAAEDGAPEQGDVDVEKMEEEEGEDAEIEVFVPKPKRYVWKDEEGSGETGATSGASLTDKLNKITGGGEVQ